MSYKVTANIHSLKMPDGTQGTDEVEIVKRLSDNDCVARYKGQYYSAIFNPFNGKYYVDDKFGLLPDYQPKTCSGYER